MYLSFDAVDITKNLIQRRNLIIFHRSMHSLAISSDLCSDGDEIQSLFED